MQRFEDLYRKITKAAFANKLEQELEKIKDEDYDENALGCLLNPEKNPPVWKINTCQCADHPCISACLFQAINIVDGQASISKDRCVGCGRCVEECREGVLNFSKDTITAIQLLQEKENKVYALLAPAYVGQFGIDEPGKVRSALRKLGFAGVIEVAAAADILTLKEALEFRHNMKIGAKYQLTSCCCPIWIQMIRRNYQEIADKLPQSVSPMIACGRIVKELYPNTKTIFIGPCVAKKAEARDGVLQGAIDCVLTFAELQDIFHATGGSLEKEEDIPMDHASALGRVYARSGGVSWAVKDTLQRIEPHTPIEIQTVQAEGVPKCKALLEDIRHGKIDGNFFEGMGCVGGCAGGPKALISKEKCTEYVDSYAKEAKYQFPLENPYVIELLHQLGYATVEEFIHNCSMLVREDE